MPGPDREEAELIERAGRGDNAAFEALLARHEEAVIRVASSILRDADAALDVAQEVFLALYRVLPGWRPRARLSSWLYRTTVNTALSHRRLRAREERLARQAPAPTAAPEPPGAEERRRLARAVEMLSARQRAVLTLKVVEGLTFAEIARILGISVSSAKTHYVRGLEALRERLRPPSDS